MEPFEVYRLYLALKLHFTTKKYDITKTRGAVKAKEATFLKRKDLTSMRKLARDYSKKEIIDLLVANFVSGDKWGGMFDSQSAEVYKEWKARKAKIEYTFEQDIAKIELEMEKENISNPFVSEDGYHPLVFRLYFGRLISIETIVLLDKMFNYATMETDDIFLQDVTMLVTKYRPFVKLTDKMKLVGAKLV